MASVFKRKGAKRYTVRFTDENGGRRERSGYTDKRRSEQYAQKLEDDARAVRDGLAPSAAELERARDRRAQAERPVTELVDDWKASMSALSAKYVKGATKYVRDFASETGAKVAADITAHRVNYYAEAKKKSGRSQATVHAYLTAIKSFTKWLASNDKILADPLGDRVKKPDPTSDRKYERRFLSVDEWRWLAASLSEDDAPARYGVSAHERMLAYATAIQTGLRVSELRTVKRGAMELDAADPFIRCKAGTTKNRRACTQYISAELAAQLAVHVRTKAPAAPVFAVPDRAAETIRADLDAARGLWLKAATDKPDEYEARTKSDFLAYANHDGEVMDFHALRHTCGVWRCNQGDHPKTVQEVMRHSSIKLTMDTYGHLIPGLVAESAHRLPSMVTTTGTESLHHILHLDRDAQRDNPGHSGTAAVKAKVG